MIRAAVYLMFLIIIALIGTIGGIWLGLNLTENYKAVERNHVLYVQAEEVADGLCIYDQRLWPVWAAV